MSKQVIQELALATQQGNATFPQVVQGLLAVGVESYLVDFAAKQKIPMDLSTIGKNFSNVLLN